MKQLSSSQISRIALFLGAQLPPDHYYVRTVSSHLPPLATLKRLFRKDGVTSHFDGRTWKRHTSRSAPTIPLEGLRVFWVANPPLTIPRRRQPIINWAESMGYQVAIETEAVDFARAYPKAQCRNFIVAFGSSASSDNSSKRCVAMLSACKGGRELVGVPVDVDLPDFCRVLLVKK